MNEKQLYLWDDTNKIFRKALCDTSGKLIISDADPFTIVQDTPEDLLHVPHGYDYGNTVYRAIAVDSSGRQLVVTYPKKVSVTVYHDSNQSIPNATDTLLSFNSELEDTDNQHDNSTNNDRLTCKIAGKYIITFVGGFASNATGYRRFYIRLNATTSIGFDDTNALNGVGTYRTLSIQYPLEVDDYIQAYAKQNSGGALNVAAGSNYSPFFSMSLLGSNA